MKRISWTLDTYNIPDYKIYDTTQHKSSRQAPLTGTLPADNTYFIGKVTKGEVVEKLLCYHITGGKYIVVSYNYSSAQLLTSVLESGVYETKTVDYNGDSFDKENPDQVPEINPTITNITYK